MNFYSRVGTPGMTVDICNGLLNNPKNGSLHLGGKARERNGFVLKSDTQITSLFESFKVQKQGGKQTGFVKQRRMQHEERLRTFASALFVSSMAS